MSRFCGLRSRWRTFRLWQKARPFNNWYIKDWKERIKTALSDTSNIKNVIKRCSPPPLPWFIPFRASYRFKKTNQTLTISGSKSPLQLSKYFFKSCLNENHSTCHNTYWSHETRSSSKISGNNWIIGKDNWLLPDRRTRTLTWASYHCEGRHATYKNKKLLMQHKTSCTISIHHYLFISIIILKCFFKKLILYG